MTISLVGFIIVIRTIILDFVPEKNALYVTATPIGNLDDITYRAVKVLKSVDFIICEDTRHTLKLLNHFDIKKRLVSSHSHNERTASKKIVQELSSGKSAAVVSDSGTPNISDPGGILVEQCRENGIKVIPLPGASAVIGLLSVCGWNTTPFVFLGFLSNKSGRRKKALLKHKDFSGVIVLYESPHRIYKTSLDLYEVLGNRQIVIGREISKKYENIFSTNLKDIADNTIKLIEKGEYVIAVKNCD